MTNSNPCQPNELQAKLVTEVWPKIWEVKYDFKIEDEKYAHLYSYANNSTSWCINNSIFSNHNITSLGNYGIKFDNLNHELKAYSKAGFIDHLASIKQFSDNYLHIKYDYASNLPTYTGILGFASALSALSFSLVAFITGFKKLGILSFSTIPLIFYEMAVLKENHSFSSFKCYKNINYHTEAKKFDFALEIDHEITVLKVYVYGNCVNSNTPTLTNHFATTSYGDLYAFCAPQYDMWLKCMGVEPEQHSEV